MRLFTREFSSDFTHALNKMMYMRRTVYLFYSLTSLLFLLACQNAAISEQVPFSTTFKLANGSNISDATADDYSPALQPLANGTLVLAFVSNRSCSAGCNGYNIFITTSTSSYANDGKLPTFNQPQPITFTGSLPNASANRFTLALVTAGNQVDLVLQQKGGIIQHTGNLNPVSASPINVGINFGSAYIGAYNCAGRFFLGFDNNGLMLAAETVSGPISRFDWTNVSVFCPINTIANSGLAAAISVNVVRKSDIGISDGYLVVETSGVISAQTTSGDGPTIKTFSEALTANSLYLTSARTMQAQQAAGDLVVFSASSSPGGPSDLYAVTNKTPAEIWLKYTKFGAQPSP